MYLYLRTYIYIYRERDTYIFIYTHVFVDSKISIYACIHLLHLRFDPSRILELGESDHGALFLLNLECLATIDFRKSL